MRTFILAPLLLLIDWFAYQAVSDVLGNAHPLISSFMAFAFWSVPAMALAYTFGSSKGWTANWPRRVDVLATTLIFILYFSKLLMAGVILVDDARRLVAWLIEQAAPGTDLTESRLAAMSRFSVMLGLIPFLTLTYGLIRNPYRYKVFRKDIHIPELPEALSGLRMVQISDIHAGSFLSKRRVQKSVELINDLEPDLVFFTGDLVNHSADEADDYIDVFGKISAKHGVYSILGNHDYGDYRPWPNAHAKRSNFEKLKEQHAKLGWDLLLNAHRVIPVNGSSVAVIGVENYSTHPRFPKYGDLHTATHGLDSTDVSILLSHDPSHWDAQVIKDHPTIDLTLSGHTHGFQFGFEFSEVIRWSPVQYVYKRWAGLYKQGRQYLYVNRGLGFLGYPGRVGILPEITLLTLRREELN